MLKTSFTSKATDGKAKAKHAIVVITNDGLKFDSAAKAVDKKAKGALSAALKAGKYAGGAGEMLSVLAPAGATGDRVVIAGIGKAAKATHLSWEKLGGQLVSHLNANGVKSAEVLLDLAGCKKVDEGMAAAHLALGAELKAYRFDKYLTTEKADKKPTLSSLKIVTDKASAAKKHAAEHAGLVEGTVVTRNIVTEPGNIIYPETFMEECKKLKELGVKVDVLTKAQMEKLGFGALLGVAQGSVKDPYTVIMRWEGAAKSKKPLAFIGKGVTFDTGGISIKPSNGMDEMKFDMGGAGTVLGLMHTLATRKAKANVIGAVGLVENMPDGNAQRPGDIVTSYSGQTIEVLNTDAEGRLVLADVLAYVNEKHKPEFMINLATLTGAILVALGDTRAGLFSNSDDLCKKLDKVAELTGEPVWRLPLGDEYDEMINSPVADMQNIGADRIAGSITAGQFLQRFVGETPWVHIDIAGTAWTKKDRPTCPKGATAYGVRLLNSLVSEYYEK